MQGTLTSLDFVPNEGKASHARFGISQLSASKFISPRFTCAPAISGHLFCHHRRRTPHAHLQPRRPHTGVERVAAAGLGVWRARQRTNRTRRQNRDRTGENSSRLCFRSGANQVERHLLWECKSTAVVVVFVVFMMQVAINCKCSPAVIETYYSYDLF